MTGREPIQSPVCFIIILKTEAKGETDMKLHMDNCVGQNKITMLFGG